MKTQRFFLATRHFEETEASRKCTEKRETLKEAKRLKKRSQEASK